LPGLFKDLVSLKYCSRFSKTRPQFAHLFGKEFSIKERNRLGKSRLNIFLPPNVKILEYPISLRVCFLIENIGGGIR